MSPEQTACEGTKGDRVTKSHITYKSEIIADLKAFERRLTEVIACLQPATYRWRIVSICVATGAGQWIMDPMTRIVPLTHSLSNHPFFIVSTILLGIIFLMGVHKRVIAASIITSRTREVLCDFNMSCDDTGKLILKPRPMNVT